MLSCFCTGFEIFFKKLYQIDQLIELLPYLSITLLLLLLFWGDYQFILKAIFIRELFTIV